MPGLHGRVIAEQLRTYASASAEVNPVGSGPHDGARRLTNPSQTGTPRRSMDVAGRFVIHSAAEEAP